ncbi:MAG: phosphotransferase [Caldilineaceae bacterium]
MVSEQCNTNRCVCARRVLVVENHPEDRADFVEDLQRWGYTPIVAEGRGEALLADAQKKAHQERCHVALVDMRLRDDNDQTDQTGLELAPALLPVRTIIVTGYGSVPVSRAAQDKYHAFKFLGKEENPETIHQVIQEAVADLCLCTCHVEPEWWIEEQIAPCLKSRHDRPVTADEIRDLLVLLFPNASKIRLEPVNGAAPPAGVKQTVARRDSFVFRAQVDQQEPLVVKFAATNWDDPASDKIKREVEHYKLHVERLLGGHHHARLEFQQRLWNIGAVAYSFIGSRGDAMLFRHVYATETSPELILTPLAHFFGEVWQRKFQECEPLDGSLYLLYDELWDHALTHAEPNWQTLAAHCSFCGIDGLFLEPRRWLAQNKALSQLPNLQQCVIHGDLHGENLFADNDGHAWVIDFERTGKGHYLTDFIELEQDILTRLARFEPQELPIFYELVSALLKPVSPQEPLEMPEAIKAHPEACKAFHVVCGLREIAARQCDYQDNQAYYWGVFLDAIFMTTKLDAQRADGRWERTLLLASLLCQRLEQWAGA